MSAVTVGNAAHGGSRITLFISSSRRLVVSPSLSLSPSGGTMIALLRLMRFRSLRGEIEDDGDVGGGKNSQARAKWKTARAIDGQVSKARKSTIERSKRGSRRRANRANVSFLPFFPSLAPSRRVITSLSARQLRRKKSSNNHIYGAAASLRCIDPRR